MASIRQLKSGSYQVQVRLKDLPPVTKSFRLKKDAQEFARHVEGDTELLRKLGRVSAEIPTFNQLVQMYMLQYQGRDPSTSSRIDWWAARFGDIPVTKIDAYSVDEGLYALHKAGLTGSTINRYKTNLSAVFIFLIQHPDFKRLELSNPVRKESVSRYRENPAKERFLTDSEQKRLLLACRQSRWERLHLLVLMALTTGARKGELLGLTWGDIDWEERTALLKRTKNGRRRKLPLTRPVIDQLLGYKAEDDVLVFPASFTRKPGKRSAFDCKKVWKQSLIDAGIEDCRFHDLRHTAASNLVRAGRTLFEVGVLLGHSSTSMTKRYSHLAVQDTRAMVDSVMGELS